LRRNIYVMHSTIHGRGVFARRPIEVGEYIGTFRGVSTTRDGPWTLWVLQDDGSLQGVRGHNALRYLNHSPRPNAEFWGADLHATRRIARDAEITIDYGEDWEDVDPV
jgi:SET domain-containing protein